MGICCIELFLFGYSLTIERNKFVVVQVNHTKRIFGSLDRKVAVCSRGFIYDFLFQ